MSDQLLMFGEETSQALTLSPLEALAKISPLLENVREWAETDQALSLKQFALLGNADQEFLSGKMLKERSAVTLAKILRQSSKSLPTLGAIDLNGNCLIHRGFYPKTESGYILSDILQHPSEVGEEFFLSQKLISTLMSRSGTLQRNHQVAKLHIHEQ
jgi:hypothetical protein